MKGKYLESEKQAGNFSKVLNVVKNDKGLFEIRDIKL
jgi:hypothetical protein